MNPHFAATQRRIERICGRLEKQLGLQEWVRIEYHYMTAAGEGDSTDSPPMASVSTQWEYRSACMKWRLDVAATYPDDELELTALHEYVHILIDPFASLIPKGKLRRKLEELATENVARALQHALAR